jgi:protoheme IX farnesyltransferase
VTFAGLLAGAALGAYLLVVSGATAAVADAAAACGTWPGCAGPLSDPATLVAVGHRLAVAVVGALLAGVTLLAWRRGAERRVRAVLSGALALYPVQAGIGALAAINGAPALLSGAHLTVGLTIFGGVALALAWQLEAETADLPDPLAEFEDVEPVADPASADAASPANDGAGDAAGAGGVGDTLLAYFRLTKPKLWWLLCLVAAAGMALAAGPELTVRTVVLTLSGGVLAIAASGTFNHVLERDIDRRMQRTADRPLATDQVGVRNAVAFGVLLTAASTALFLQVNVLAAALGLVAVAFYSVVYTLVLKPNTVQNTVVGGFAGALPALIGWAAVTESVGVPAVALAGVIFLWTPAHFYNLAMAHREDYARGGFPMLPVVEGPAVARKHVLLYLAATLVASAALAAVSPLGPLYAATTVLLGGVFLWAVLRLHRERTEAAAMRAFHASNAFLGSVLVAVVIDALVLA